MIFVTTGTQLPFPRLIDAVEQIAPQLDEDIVAQVGPDKTPRKGLDVHPTMFPDEFERYFNKARVVVAHAGIGSILSAERWHKPLIIMPRLHAKGEHRNDHQMATARQVSKKKGVYVAEDSATLLSLLQTPSLDTPQAGAGPEAERLIARIRQFILD